MKHELLQTFLLLARQLPKIRITKVGTRVNHLNCIKLGLGVPRNTYVTCPGSFRKVAKGNYSKNIDARVMDLVHDS